MTTIYSIFVLRYWVLSRKIRSVLNQIEDLNSDFKAKIIFICLTVWIGVISILFLVYAFLHSLSYLRFLVLELLYCVPNLILVVFLIDAIIVLNKIKKSQYTISTKKVLLFACTIIMGLISGSVTVINN